MHLTNYSINKRSKDFIKDELCGHKRSLKQVFEMLQKEFNIDLDDLWGKIKDLIIKSIISVLPSLQHIYKSCQSEDIANNMCFELLGFDVLLDSNFKPFLLEVNHSPSFDTDTDFDLRIKKTMFTDLFKVLHFSAKTRT